MQIAMDGGGAARKRAYSVKEAAGTDGLRADASQPDLDRQSQGAVRVRKAPADSGHRNRSHLVGGNPG